MLQNAYFLAKIGADTAENERNFAEILPKIGNYPLSEAPSTRLGPGLPPVEGLDRGRRKPEGVEDFARKRTRKSP